MPPAGSRAGTYLRLTAIAVSLLVAGLALPLLAGERTSDTVEGGAGPNFTPTAGPDPATGDELTEAETAPLPEPAMPPDPTDDTAGSAPASSTAPSPGPSSGPSSTPASSPAPLAATDVGVTATAVRVGLLVLDVGPVGRAGAAVAIDPEQQRAAWGSFVDEVNERGGINGRTLEAHFATFDVLSDDSARRACLELTEDKKVFAVLGGFSKPASALCVLDEHQTPMVDYIGYHPDSLYRRAAGRLFSTFPTATRMMTNYVGELERLGVLRGRAVGVVSDDQTDPGYETGDLLVGLLEAAGHEVAHQTRLAGSASSQVAIEVQQMRTKGVEVVMLLSGTLNSQSFTQAASSQGWRPQWTGSDWGTMNGDTTMKSAGESFDGAIGVTSTRNYEFRGNKPEPVAGKQCREIYERRTGRRLAPRGEAENSLTMHFCDTFRVFHAAASKAGPRLTRPSFIAAGQALGPFALAGVGDGSFGPGKFDATDVVRIQRWKLSCRCWTYVDDFHRGRA